LTWVERNPECIAKIRTYISDFQNVKPKLFDYFEGARTPVFPFKVESEQGLGLLLFYCALYQNISQARLIRLLQDLWIAYGSDFFALNRLPFDTLQNRIQAMTDLEDWVLTTKAPGILRSVCDFIHKHGPILTWVRTSKEVSDPVLVLADEIFFMGKTSDFKSKPRYFLWLLTQLPNAKPEQFWNSQSLVPITSGQIRFMRDFGPLKGKRHSPWVTAKEKLDYCNRFYQMLFPGKSWMVYTALDAYLKATTASPSLFEKSPKEKIWLCRQFLSGCLNCVLASECQGCEEV
jgi:hypothetical protein